MKIQHTAKLKVALQTIWDNNAR